MAPLALCGVRLNWRELRFGEARTLRWPLWFRTSQCLWSQSHPSVMV